MKPLNNVRVRCCVSLVARTALRRLANLARCCSVITGVSGIAVFNLSRFARPGDKLRIDLLQIAPEKAEGLLLDRAARLRLAGRPCSADALVRACCCPRWPMPC